MSDRNGKELLLWLIPMVLHLAVWIFFHLDAAFMTEGDDAVIKAMLYDKSIFTWVREYYHSWGARFPLELTACFFLNLPEVIWKAADMVLIFLLLEYGSRILLCLYPYQPVRMFLARMCLVILFALIPAGVRVGAVTWTTGAFNYLWPNTFLLISLYPYIKVAAGNSETKITVKESVMIFAGLIYCGFSEQTVAIFCCAACVCLVYIRYEKRRIPKVLYAALLLAAACALLQLTAPGVASRSFAEALTFEQGYEMYRFSDKVMLGIVHTAYIFSHRSVIHWLLPLVLCAVHAVRQPFWRKAEFAVMAVLFLLSVRILRGIDDGVNIDIYDQRKLLKLFVIVAALLLTGVWLWGEGQTLLQKITLCSFYAAGMMSGIVTGLTATVHGSGDRIFFSTYLWTMMLSAALVLSDAVSLSAGEQVRPAAEPAASAQKP